MLSPDDVDALLAQPDRHTDLLTERDEIEIRTTFQPLLDALGPDEYQLMVARLALPYEAFLRRTEPPDHPTLALIDELRALGRLE